MKQDVHAKLMNKYKKVPEWWFQIILIGSVLLSFVMCIVWKDQVQLPWWGFMLAFLLAVTVTLPIGAIQATTNQVSNFDHESSILNSDHLLINAAIAL